MNSEGTRSEDVTCMLQNKAKNVGMISENGAEVAATAATFAVDSCEATTVRKYCKERLLQDQRFGLIQNFEIGSVAAPQIERFMKRTGS